MMLCGWARTGTYQHWSSLGTNPDPLQENQTCVVKCEKCGTLQDSASKLLMRRLCMEKLFTTTFKPGSVAVSLLPAESSIKGITMSISGDSLNFLGGGSQRNMPVVRLDLRRKPSTNGTNYFMYRTAVIFSMSLEWEGRGCEFDSCFGMWNAEEHLQSKAKNLFLVASCS